MSHIANEEQRQAERAEAAIRKRIEEAVAHERHQAEKERQELIAQAWAFVLVVAIAIAIFAATLIASAPDRAQLGSCRAENKVLHAEAQLPAATMKQLRLAFTAFTTNLQAIPGLPFPNAPLMGNSTDKTDAFLHLAPFSQLVAVDRIERVGCHTQGDVHILRATFIDKTVLDLPGLDARACKAAVDSAMAELTKRV